MYLMIRVSENGESVKREEQRGQVKARKSAEQLSVERLILQVATIRSDFPQGHAGGQTGRWDKTAGQS